ncbi:MAG: hypothetical protein E6Q76_09640, partial [Rhizobium sp.]
MPDTDDLFTAADVKEIALRVGRKALRKGLARRAAEVAELRGALAVAAAGGLTADVVLKALGRPVAKAAPKASEAIAEAIRGFDAEALDGLRVEYHPDGPQVWIDQMDWHDGKAGKVVIAAAEKALGVEAEEGYKHKDGLPKGPGVYVFNEGPKPPGDGWVDMLRESRPDLFKATKPTAAVDLDGTLAAYDGWKGSDHFGDPLPGAAEFLKDLAQTHRILIFTTRTKDDDPALLRTGNAQNRHALASLVRGWLDRHQMPYDDVYIGQGKPIADVYVDDRAVAVPPNPAPDDYTRALDAIRQRSVLKAESQPDPLPDADDDTDPDDTDVWTGDPDVAALLLAAVNEVEHAEPGEDVQPVLDALFALRDDPGELHDLLGDTLQKAFDSDKHPRGDDGRFIAKKDIAAAQNDPAKAEALKQRVTDPEQRKKLDAALKDTSGGFIPAKDHAKRQTAQKREQKQADRRTALDLVYQIRDAHASGRPVSADDLHALIPHLSKLNHDELSNVRTQLFRMGASFGGTRRLQERADKLAAWA